MSGSDSVDWHGSFAVIVTPFTRDGDIDEEGYRGVIDLVIDAGCHGVISAGSTGEFFLMTHEERMRVFSIAVDQAAGRVPVLAGTSATRTDDVVALTRYASEIGCDGAMVLPPIYIGIDERETVEFFSRVAGESGLPIMLYNSPLAVMTELPARLVERLARIDNVVAIKDSSLDMNQVSDLVRLCGDDFKVFIGAEDLMLAAVAMGAEERSSSPALPSVAKRRTHFVTVARETRNCRATSAWRQPALTSCTSSQRVTGVSRALRCAMRDLSAIDVHYTQQRTRDLALSTTYVGTTPRWLLE